MGEKEAREGGRVAVLHWIAFPVVGFLVAVLVVRRDAARRAAVLTAGALGGIAGGLLLYHGGAADHHRFLSLVAAALVALATSAVTNRFDGVARRGEAGMRRR